MGTGEQELKLKATVAGAKEAARDIGAVGKATEQVGKQTGTATQPIKGHTEAQEKLNAAASDYAEILMRINPALGTVVLAGEKLAKILNDLGGKQGDFGEVTKKVTGLIKQNAGAMLLLGVGTAAFLAVQMMIDQWRKMREEIKAVNQEAQEFADRETLRQRHQIDLQEEVNRAIDRRGKAVGLEARQTAARTAERLAGYGVAPGTAVEIASGLAAGGLQGAVGEGGLGIGATAESREALLTLAQLLQSSSYASDWARAGLDRGSLDLINQAMTSTHGRDAAANAQAQQQQREQNRQAAKRALESGYFQGGWGGWKKWTQAEADAAQTTAPTAALRDIIKEVFGEQKDMDRTVKLLIQLKALLSDPDVQKYLDPKSGLQMVDLHGNRSPIFSPETRLKEQLDDITEELDLKEVTPSELAELRAMLNTIEQRIARGGDVTVNYTKHTNDKYVVAPGSASTVGKGRRQVAGD